MSTNYDIDYNDKRFTDVESDKSAALNEIESTYDNMINQSDSYYQEQINASKEWADKQAQLQQEQTDFAIEKIEQQKKQTEKDYIKEQSGAYVDWQKQSNQYGANAEQMAAQGLAGSGYSESSQVSMYNTYQNRVATAIEAYNQAILNYNNAITEARLQNNSLLAEIAYNAFQQQLELSLQGFQYKNQLLLSKAEQKLTVDQMYYSRYQDVLAQINHENALKEQQRQFDLSHQLDQARLAEQKRQFDLQMAANAASKATIKKGKGSSGSSKSGGRVTKSSGTTKGVTAVTKDFGGSNGSSKNPPIDMNSVLKLGKGPISAKTLYKMVEAGQVKQYIEDGKTKFKKTDPGTPYFNPNWKR